MTPTEQEYLKQIYMGIANGQNPMHTYLLADQVGAKPASVTDMIKRLSKKGLLNYRKSLGFTLSDKGTFEALQVIRRHRLWELFLAEYLEIDWKEVHTIATELQSVTNSHLIEALEIFMGRPVYDPHGELIPDAQGNLPQLNRREIYDMRIGEEALITGYRDTGTPFLLYVEKLGLLMGRRVVINEILEYNHSLEIKAEGMSPVIIGKETAQKIYVDKC
jgi:DtxR family transcriptional regulator, Mn-dependent transcriptional regulator